ncbi:hypothetical protein [Burkholderia sp. Ac-20344]|uniref:hypothetical protein n=1 Tax=Burkholderia sp. Ac-20344 TaxID=2703890 RepID=UPI00197BB736|nr:hypothetical protein [Burkholderia sp. Ac-20344]MBN3833101.1 hypothetical protein [Burkholderia sp. Ac-20344]
MIWLVHMRRDAFASAGHERGAGAASGPRCSRRTDERVSRAHVKLARSPAAESAFRIAESTSNSRAAAFSSLENMFYIAKITT